MSACHAGLLADNRTLVGSATNKYCNLLFLVNYSIYFGNFISRRCMRLASLPAGMARWDHSKKVCLAENWTSFALAHL
jgi:hypothetical protein